MKAKPHKVADFDSLGQPFSLDLILIKIPFAKNTNAMKRDPKVTMINPAVGLKSSIFFLSGSDGEF